MSLFMWRHRRSKRVETCVWQPEHEAVTLTPRGPRCGAPATHIIWWLDGTRRHSPCCDEHLADLGPNVPPHSVEPIRGER